MSSVVPKTFQTLLAFHVLKSGFALLNSTEVLTRVSGLKFCKDSCEKKVSRFSGFEGVFEENKDIQAEKEDCWKICMFALLAQFNPSYGFSVMCAFTTRF